MTPETLLLEADRCVKCGLCLRHCPTYRLQLDEAESPRGRIALMQALAGSVLQPADVAAGGQLDHCLGCRRCEKHCPSGVAYGALIDGARALYGYPLSKQLADRLIKPSKQLLLLARLALATGLARFVSGITGRMLALARYSHKPASFANLYPARTEPIGAVGLFQGCQTAHFDAAMQKAAIHLLTRAGYAVHLPQAQVCCGALHQHAGHPETAVKLMAQNRQAFDAKRLSAIAVLGTGCGAQLQEHAGFTVPVQDVVELLLGKLPPVAQASAGKVRRVGLYSPCTQSAAGRKAERALLEQLPNCEIVELKALGCCGAAGATMLLFPEQAARLAAPLVEAIEKQGLDLVLTANIGCALHLKEQLHQHRLAVAVHHPLELLAEYWS